MSQEPHEIPFFCILPWMHLMIQPNGNVYSCCEASASSPVEGRLGNVKEQGLDEIWNSDKIQEIRRQLGSGTIPPQCQKCAKLEGMGFLSDRLVANEKFKDMLDDKKNLAATEEINLEELNSYDLRLSNMCNFSCRTCTPEQSSKWALDYQLLTGENLTSPALITTFSTPKEMSEVLLKNTSSIKRLFFAGGEPMLQIEHFEILTKLIELGHTRCKTEYISNLSTLTFRGYDVIDLWQNFKEVELSISVDGVAALGEYIREGLNWDTFSKNLKRVQTEAPHVSISTNVTVSILNIDELDLVIEHCLKEFKIRPEALLLTPLVDPLPFRLTILPAKIKEKLHQKLIKKCASYPAAIKEQVHGVVNYMMSSDESKHWKLFQAHNKRLDQIRGQSFQKVSTLLNYLT